jgi:hypothetical protein
MKIRTYLKDFIRVLKKTKQYRSKVVKDFGIILVIVKLPAKINVQPDILLHNLQ